MRSIAALLFVGLLAGCMDSSGDEADNDLPLDSATYAIALSDFPTLPVAAGATFRFNSTISGDAEHTSDHIGAHFGNSTTTEPSPAVYTSICAHSGGTLPGKYQVTCTAPPTAGIYYLRGHARVTEGEVVVNWWSPETTFTVA